MDMYKTFINNAGNSDNIFEHLQAEEMPEEFDKDFLTGLEFEEYPYSDRVPDEKVQKLSRRQGGSDKLQTVAKLSVYPFRLSVENADQQPLNNQTISNNSIAVESRANHGNGSITKGYSTQRIY